MSRDSGRESRTFGLGAHDGSEQAEQYVPYELPVIPPLGLGPDDAREQQTAAAGGPEADSNFPLEGPASGRDQPDRLTLDAGAIRRRVSEAATSGQPGQGEDEPLREISGQPRKALGDITAGTWELPPTPLTFEAATGFMELEAPDEPVEDSLDRADEVLEYDPDFDFTEYIVAKLQSKPDLTKKVKFRDRDGAVKQHLLRHVDHTFPDGDVMRIVFADRGDWGKQLEIYRARPADDPESQQPLSAHMYADHGMGEMYRIDCRPGHPSLRAISLTHKGAKYHGDRMPFRTIFDDAPDEESIRACISLKELIGVLLLAERLDVAQ